VVKTDKDVTMDNQQPSPQLFLQLQDAVHRLR
jgi:hypothetical protein